MKDQAEIFQREIMGRGSRINSKAREREDASALPLFDGRLDLRSPHEVGLVGGGGSFVGNGDIIVRALHLVLGAITATRESLVGYMPKPQVAKPRTIEGSSRHIGCVDAC